MGKYQLIATAAMGLEALVAKEVRALGYECEVENGKVIYSGDETAMPAAICGCVQLTE
jgi:putative N6-adenine-specific DNA methylase